MRISDWSSDVCSSDLGRAAAARRLEPDVARPRHLGREDDRVARLRLHPAADDLLGPADPLDVGRYRIALGGVVDIDSGVEAAVEDAECRRLVGLAADGPRSPADIGDGDGAAAEARSEEPTSELQSLLR